MSICWHKYVYAEKVREHIFTAETLSGKKCAKCGKAKYNPAPLKITPIAEYYSINNEE